MSVASRDTHLAVRAFQLEGIGGNRKGHPPSGQQVWSRFSNGPVQRGDFDGRPICSLADSDWINDPTILHSLTPNAAFFRDEEDDPNLINDYFLVAVFFSLSETFDILDYNSFTSAYDISSAIKSVTDTGKLIAGSTVEQTISDILTTVFGGVNVMPAKVTGGTADEQGESRAEILWWLRETTNGDSRWTRKTAPLRKRI